MKKIIILLLVVLATSCNKAEPELPPQPIESGNIAKAPIAVDHDYTIDFINADGTLLLQSKDTTYTINLDELQYTIEQDNL